jgi:hypothetical protein
LQEGDGALLALVGQDLDEGDARGVVEADVDELPADATALAGPLTGDAVADLLEAAELLDVEVDQLAGVGALVAPDRRGRRQVLEPAQPAPAQDAADGGRLDADLPGDLVTGPALAAQRGDLLDGGVRRRLAQPTGPRGAIDQPCRALGLEALAPFAHGLDVDAQGRGHGLRRLSPDQHASHELGSTMRRQSGILVDVHSVPPGH